MGSNYKSKARMTSANNDIYIMLFTALFKIVYSVRCSTCSNPG